MKLIKKLQEEILKVYKAYWDGYLMGDVEGMSVLLADEYTQIGSAETEVFFNKKDAVQFLYDTIDQVAGKSQMRNKSIRLEPLDYLILIHDIFDVYVLSNNEWIFYGQLRASTLMEKKQDGWKFIHQHSSFPDARTGQGENLAIDKIAEENRQLREAVKRRTIELEYKNRELEIEAALERVRAKVIGMNQSHELKEISYVFGDQMRNLGIAWQFSYFWLIDEEKDSNTYWITWPDNNTSVTIYPLSEADQLTQECLSSWKKAVKIHDSYVPPDNVHVFLDTFSQLAIDAGGAAKEIMQAGNFSNGVYYYDAMMKYGSLGICINKPVTDEEKRVQCRFAMEFERAYTRFLDMQKAEAQAKEAIKASSLDRIRAEIASMRTTDDLQRITPSVWKELTVLGVPFSRCGVFIVDEKEEKVHVYLSTPDGKPLAVLHLDLDTSDFIRSAAYYWRLQEVYTMHWDREQFTAWVQFLIGQGQIQTADTYLGGDAPPEALTLQLVPFVQGMLYVGSTEALTENQIELVQALAEAFSVAYARYDDFKKLEEAKSTVETTLQELKATQAQLIQKEKMASLGELTAGIAHEIQNPLNFVNNFSEVNAELIVETQQDIEADNKAQALDAVHDIRENNQKIALHGKRADAIVKSMIEHSRSSTGQKEPTDLNALVDEYLRLAFHGMRAKNKDFNACIETAYDQQLGKVNVVPQDMGRVLLNLFNNAFYSVKEKKVQLNGAYEPIVSVSTTRANANIEISIWDNGLGIPQKIVNKIYQPFFTTKPTGQGTGLGLSLSYDIVVKEHGGELRVETQEGEWTEFIVELPE